MPFDAFQSISWFLTIVALYGTYLNSNQDRTGFYFWLVSNIGFCFIFTFTLQFAQAFLFAAYTALAIRGILKWK